MPAEELSAPYLMLACKSLRHTELLMRTLKSLVTKVRLIQNSTGDGVRANIFLCVLASYLEWHLGEAWTPFLFDRRGAGCVR